MEKMPKINGVLRGTCCETCRNISQNIPIKDFIKLHKKLIPKPSSAT